MRLVWLLVVGALIFVVASFGFQNARYVTIEYFGAQLSGVPLWLVVAVPAAAGLLIGSLMAIPGRVRAGMTRRRVAKQGETRDRTGNALQLRVVELERDLALSRLAVPAPVKEAVRPPDVRDGSDASNDGTTAAATAGQGQLMEVGEPGVRRPT